MSAPEKVHLIPDEWHIDGVGRFPDGTLIFSDSQISRVPGQPGKARDFYSTFFFDPDGNLIRHQIDFVGVRGEYTEAHADAICDRHVDLLRGFGEAPIQVRPFQVEAFGEIFGLVVRPPQDMADPMGPGYQPTDKDWRVSFQPGDTLSFYPPWEEGGYDT